MREVKAAEALEAEGRWRRVGRVMVERVYDRPVSNPTEMEPTNFNVVTVLAAMMRGKC